jgi:dTDP-4-amino-4,6-dideoxygalactose transaminase
VFEKLRFYGYDTDEVGINSRMDEFQASIVKSKLEGFEELNAKRCSIAKRYRQHVKSFRVQSSCVYYQFVVQFNERETVLNELRKRDIPYLIHYPQHVSEMDIMKGIHNLVTYRVNDSVVSLPVHPFMDENDIVKVEEFLHAFKNYERGS